MTDCETIATLIDGDEADPRLADGSVRCFERRDSVGSVLLIGVVHDHPSSEYRVGTLLQRFDPDIVALELPPLAVPLFEQYAADVEVPPQHGGEMSIAIQSTDARVVGIDAPNGGYLRRLVRQLAFEDRLSPIGRSLLTDLLRMTTQAVATRVGAFVGRIIGRPPVLYSPIRYDTSSFDDPSTQAQHEQGHLARRDSFLRAIEPPPAIERIDGLREQTMVDRITALRGEGDVAVVIGMEHVEAVADGIAP